MTLPEQLARSPDAAVAVCVLGILLIYLEFNRPGLIVPGAVGLTALLLGIAAFAKHTVAPTAVLCLVFAAVILLRSARKRTPWLLSAAAAVAIVVGCRNLIRPPDRPQVRLLTALLAGILLGPGTSLLTAIARRARVNKGLD